MSPASSPPLPADARALRAVLRARRRALPAAARRAAAAAVVAHVSAALRLRAGARIALYLPLAEELDTVPLLRWACRRGLEIYLPRIVDARGRRMRFCRLGPILAANRYGIAEPVGTPALDPRWLAVVFLPLVAFDACGARLGMGEGYYDRALAFRRQRQAWRGPWLIGVGYAMQQVPQLAQRAHDVRLDAVVTEQGFTRLGDRPA